MLAIPIKSIAIHSAILYEKCTAILFEILNTKSTAIPFAVCKCKIKFSNHHWSMFSAILQR